MMNDKAPLYSAERDRRWKDGATGEPKAINYIAEYLAEFLDMPNGVEAIRYDKMWFDEFDLNKAENEWVKGASDYCLNFQDTLIYAEIKIKNQRFHKTVNGGTTQAGSVITPYGCESFYIDIEPVLRNMNLFCEHLHIDKKAFLVFFCTQECDDIHFISLSRINSLVSEGYKGKPLNRFTEGYGKMTENGRAENYLIPVDATIDLLDIKNALSKVDNTIEKNFLISYAQERLRQADDIVYYTDQQSFYHLKRDCRFIKNKKEAEINSCNLSEIINKKMPCKECGK